jgi:hypothetical protein
VKNNGEKTDWGYDWKEELNDKIIETKKRSGKVERDYEDLNFFLLKDVLLEEVAERFGFNKDEDAKSESKSQDESPDDAPEKLPDAVDEEGVDDDTDTDVPF